MGNRCTFIRYPEGIYPYSRHYDNLVDLEHNIKNPPMITKYIIDPSNPPKSDYDPDTFQPMVGLNKDQSKSI